MADLTSAILALDEVKANFTVVERTWGQALLHNTMPVWIVEYDAFPREHQPKHWQAYFSPDTMGREPWAERNYRLSSSKYEWTEPAGAVAAALAKAAALAGVTTPAQPTPNSLYRQSVQHENHAY